MFRFKAPEPTSVRAVTVTVPVLPSLMVTDAASVPRVKPVVALVPRVIAPVPAKVRVVKAVPPAALMSPADSSAVPVLVNDAEISAVSAVKAVRVNAPAELSVTVRPVVAPAVAKSSVTVFRPVEVLVSVMVKPPANAGARTRVSPPVPLPVIANVVRAASAVLVTDNALLPVLLAVKVAKAVPAKVVRVKPPAELSLMVNAVGVAKVVIVSVLVAVAEVESLMVTAPLKVSTMIAAVLLAAVLPVRLMVARLLEVMVPADNAAPLVLLSVAVVRPAAVTPAVRVNVPPTVLVSFSVSVVIDGSVMRVAIVSPAARLSFTVSDVAAVVKAPVIDEATTELPLAVTV